MFEKTRPARISTMALQGYEGPSGIICLGCNMKVHHWDTPNCGCEEWREIKDAH